MNNKILYKKIDADWGTIFKSIDLTRYGVNQYYKIFGSLLIGIRLHYGIGYYRPAIYAYGFWCHSLSDLFKTKVIEEYEFNSKKNLQLDITFEQHSQEFEETSMCVLSQAHFLSQDDIKFEVIKDLLYKRTLSMMPHLYNRWAGFRYFTNLFKIGLYIDKNIAINVMNDMSKVDWDYDNLLSLNINITRTFDNFNSLIKNYDSFIALINKNESDKKFSKLKKGKILR